MIVALAGRRVDAEGTDVRRFPATEIQRVRAEIRDCLREQGASTIVCSAASGVDLLALDVAGELGLRRRVVLPFGRKRFRSTSVADRPGDWGRLFDRICAEVYHSKDLIVLHAASINHKSYERANQIILKEALSLGLGVASGKDESTRPEGVIALIVWDGAPRSESDLTAAFMKAAQSKGLQVLQVSTR